MPDFDSSHDDRARNTNTDIPSSAADNGTDQELQGDETLRVPLLREELVPEVTDTELGTVRIHKHVVTETERHEVPLTRQDVVVEREDRNEPVEARRAPWHEQDDLIIPIYEEVPVVTTQLILKSILRVRHVESTETVAVEGDVRREVIEVEGPDGTVHQG